MIFVRDRGRLCNNILQYGHVYAWGREHGRATMSMRFAYKYRYFHICHTPRHNFLWYAAAKYAAKWGWLPVVSFDSCDADYSREEDMMLGRKNIVVQGWYARWYDLFLKYKPEILELFAFDERVQARPRRLLNTLPDGTVLLGVHVRRGDYITWHGGQYYYSDSQYIGFIRQFLDMQNGRQVQVLVCGNDPKLDRQAYVRALPEANVLFPDGNPGEDLYLLSQCHWLIGPPSTFTLVAAMYCDVPLCWLESAGQSVTPSSFSHFDQLFRKIK